MNHVLNSIHLSLPLSPRGAGLFIKLALILSLAGSPGLSRATDSSTRVLQEALAAICEAPHSDLNAMAARLPGGATPTNEDPRVMRGMDVGWERRFELPDGAEIRADQFAPQAQLRRLSVEYWEAGADGRNRPQLAVIAGSGCHVSAARRMVYEPYSPHPVALQHLDADLLPIGDPEPLNPPVPPGRDPGGVAVAHIDSGVNYLLPEIHERLARDAAGEMLGHDYWDLDTRPFDAHPAQSPFFPQRHGTRTASVLLNEAPWIRLVPYRYPRPDMGRMQALIEDAASKGIIVVNLSMGSDDPGDWESFASAAQAHPDMLFIVSAGNNGRDIDAQPVYPAASRLDNTVVVTSAMANGELARGSNWGVESVDLMVPAEGLTATDFDGNRVQVSGSSHAAARVSALAARLLADNPDWRAPELKQALFQRVVPSFDKEPQWVARGFIPRPEIAEGLPPLASDGPPGPPGEHARHQFTSDDLYPDAPSSLPAARVTFEPTFAFFPDAGWDLDTLRKHSRETANILAQCGVHMPVIHVRSLQGPPVYHYFNNTIGTELVNALGLPKPTVYFVRDTLQVDPYDAEAIGTGNSATRPALRHTIWFTRAARDPGIALAHELVHILMDSGEHVEEPGNLMRAATSPTNTNLTPRQCEAIISRGTANGMLSPVTP